MKSHPSTVSYNYLKLRGYGQPYFAPYGENCPTERQKNEASGRENYIQMRVSKTNESIKVLACSYFRGSAAFLFWVLVRLSNILMINLPFA